MDRTYPSQLVTEFFRAQAASYISPMSVKKMLDEGSQDIVLVDVRLQSPALKWRLPNSIAMPLPEVKRRATELPTDKLIVLICWDTWCSLATSAALVLLEAGFEVKELSGGVAAWGALNLPKQSVTETNAVAIG
jgi:rhodanese-related sulfurtransferase